jgi:hypothetical protein
MLSVTNEPIILSVFRLIVIMLSFVAEFHGTVATGITHSKSLIIELSTTG